MLKAKFNSDVGRVVANRKKQTALRNKIALSGGSPYANYNSDALMASVKGLGNIYDSLDDDNIEDVHRYIHTHGEGELRPWDTTSPDDPVAASVAKVMRDIHDAMQRRDELSSQHDTAVAQYEIMKSRHETMFGPDSTYSMVKHVVKSVDRARQNAVLNSLEVGLGELSPGGEGGGEFDEDSMYNLYRTLENQKKQLEVDMNAIGADIENLKSAIQSDDAKIQYLEGQMGDFDATWRSKAPAALTGFVGGGAVVGGLILWALLNIRNQNRGIFYRRGRRADPYQIFS